MLGENILGTFKRIAADTQQRIAKETLATFSTLSTHVVQTETLRDDHHAKAAAAASECSEHREDSAESGPRPGGGQEPRAEP